MTGVCGTCGRDATATPTNQGYSDCCNDRIEYGEEGEETRREIIAEERARGRAPDWQPSPSRWQEYP